MTTRTETETGRGMRRASSLFLALGLVFFGLAAWRMQSDADPSTFASLFALSLGAGLALRAVAGLQTGQIRIRRRTVERIEQPGAFWAAVVLFGVIGMVLALAGVLRLVGVL